MFALPLACRKAPSANPGAPAAESNPGWRIFEDANLKVSYPPDFEAFTANPGVIALGLDASRSTTLVGQVIIGPQTGPAGLLLRDAAETEARQYTKNGGKILGGIRPLSVPNGSCLLILEGATMDMALCDAPKAARIQISCFLPGPGADKAAEVRKEVDTCERVVRSLQFKT